jgi:MFS transporter, SIT family, siderophore-iron:H+ symporter
MPSPSDSRAGVSAPLLGADDAISVIQDASSSLSKRPQSSHRERGSSTTPASIAPATTSTAAVIKSTGVARIDAIAVHLTTTQRALLFLAIFVVGYAYGLESQVRSAYQPYATASFSLHSYLATINVLRSVVAVAVQPTAAKIADVFGRFEVVAVSTVLYTLGITIEATAGGVTSYCVGSIIYQVGYTCIVLLMEVLVADLSSMRARVFFSYIPAVPFLVNTWISGNVTSAVLARTSWRWGLGMWAIIYPIASLPLLGSLYYIEHRAARRYFDADSHDLKRSKAGFREVATQLVHQVDAVGLITVVLAFSLVLAPLTIAGGTVSRWREPSMVGPLAVGLVLSAVFVIWEQRGARHPLVPFHLLADRGVWGALAVRSLLNFAWYTQGNYLYTVLVVAFDFSVGTATRISSFYSFFGVLSGVITGLIIYKIRRLKYVIIAGTCIFMASFGILIKYSGGATEASQWGLIGGQILLGLAGGLFAYPTQASIQASASREHVAILTGLYLSFYNVGSALGTCLSGALWTTTLLPTLQESLAFQPNKDLARQMYNSPFAVIAHYPVGTDIRTAIIESYSRVQQLLCVAGITLCVPMIAFALALRNPRLSEDKVQPDAEFNYEEVGDDGEYDNESVTGVHT